MSKSTSNSTGQPEIVPGRVLVKHYRLHSGSSDVDSASIRYQFYHPEVYDEFVREDEERGKFNTFIRQGLKTEVIYNPERDENGAPIDVKPKAAKVEAPKSESKAKAAPKAKAASKSVEAPKSE